MLAPAEGVGVVRNEPVYQGIDGIDIDLIGAPSGLTRPAPSSGNSHSAAAPEQIPVCTCDLHRQAT